MLVDLGDADEPLPALGSGRLPCAACWPGECLTVCCQQLLWMVGWSSSPRGSTAVSLVLLCSPLSTACPPWHRKAYEHGHRCLAFCHTLSSSLSSLITFCHAYLYLVPLQPTASSMDNVIAAVRAVVANPDAAVALQPSQHVLDMLRQLSDQSQAVPP